METLIITCAVIFAIGFVIFCAGIIFGFIGFGYND